jgi:TolB-like protein
VLPFQNMSADPEQEFFADGMTEDIITALSKIPALFVIARNSTFVYKGKAVNIPQVGRELGVRYVLEGSVRRAGQRLRITAQLIDAKDGSHLWAERYDRQAEDIFDVQDDISRNVTTALQVTLTWGETSRLWQDGTRNFEAWQCMSQAWDQWYQQNRLGAFEARRLAERAVELDPDYAAAWGLIAWTNLFETRFLNPGGPKRYSNMPRTSSTACLPPGWLKPRRGIFDVASTWLGVTPMRPSPPGGVASNWRRVIPRCTLSWPRR